VHWCVIASLIETCKLNAVDPQAYLASTLINRHPASQIDQLMPWAYDQVPCKQRLPSNSARYGSRRAMLMTASSSR
jgi:hypothetical protein